VKTCGHKPIKFEKITNMKIEINTGNVPGMARGPKTALSSVSRYDISMPKVFLTWDPTIQYTWGRSTTGISAAAQFMGKSVPIILTEGSNEEKRLPI
jgi:hypothetical protein